MFSKLKIVWQLQRMCLTTCSHARFGKLRYYAKFSTGWSRNIWLVSAEVLCMQRCNATIALIGLLFPAKLYCNSASVLNGCVDDQSSGENSQLIIDQSANRVTADTPHQYPYNDRSYVHVFPAIIAHVSIFLLCSARRLPCTRSGWTLQLIL